MYTATLLRSLAATAVASAKRSATATGRTTTLRAANHLAAGDPLCLALQQEAIAVAQRGGAGGHDAVTFGYSRKDFRKVIRLDPHLDRAERGGVVGLGEEHTASAAFVHNGVGRDDDRVVMRSRRDADAR